MKEIYKALEDIKISLLITNNLEIQCVVKINDYILDDVILSGTENNTRVLEIDLKANDVLKITNDKNINYNIA